MKATSYRKPHFFIVVFTLLLVTVFLSTGSSPAATNRGLSASSPRLEWSMDFPMDIPISEAAELGLEGARLRSSVPLVAKLQKAGVTFSQTPLLTMEKGFFSRFNISGKGGIEDFRHLLFRVMKPEFNPLGGVTELEISGASLESLNIDLILEANPSTGYGWHLVTDGSFIERATKINQMVSSGFGLPQKQTLRLGLGSSRTGSIRLVYRRAWEEEAAPTRRITLKLSSLPAKLNLSDPDIPAARTSYPAESYLKTTVLPGLPGLPASFDWRTQNMVTPVKDQGQCGSCWAFGTVSVMESAVLKAGGPLRNFSEQFLVSCNNDGYSCDGGYAAHEYHYDTRGKNQTGIGAVLEADKPYTATNGSCTTALPHYEKLNAWAYVKPNMYNIATVDEIKNAIYTYGVVTTGVCVGDAFQAYTGGIFTTDEKSDCYSSGSYYANHLVSLVGWDDSGQYFIMKNSWGSTGWGESGYMRIHYNISLIGQHLSWGTVATASSQVATPTFSPAPGTYSNSVVVTISCSTNGATIKYTTDGSDPISSSTPYSGPLTLTTTTTLKAKAFLSGMADSAVAGGIYSISSSLSLNTALDNGNLTFSTGGNAAWFGQTSVFYYGSSAAQNGDIADYQVSWLQTTVSGPGSLSFYWRVSSETYYDYLRFYIDGVEQSGSISGNVGWQQKNFFIPSGSHTLTWAYTKDESLSSGSDSGWLDRIEFSSQRPPNVATSAASGVTTATATLNGTVNPNGLSTNYYFQWGTTDSYGSTTGIQSAGSGSSNVAVTAGLNGLSPSTLYHFRLVATNSGGTSYGSDLTFTTLGPPVAATPITPWGNLALTSPTYYWYAISNATQYCLMVNDSTGTRVNHCYSAEEAGCASGTGVCSATPSAVLAQGSGNWQIQTRNTYGDGPWSSVLNFDIVPSVSRVDFNSDGKADLLWRNKVSGDIAVWYMNGPALINGAVIYQAMSLSWEIAGTADFNNDGKTDLLWRNKVSGDIAVWYMNGPALINGAVIYQAMPLSWEIAGAADFNNDGKADLLWRNKVSGDIAVWYMNGPALINGAVIYQAMSLSWEIAGTADFNNDGKTDLLWRNKVSGDIAVWYMNGPALINGAVIYQAMPLSWEIAGAADFNNDGKTDLLWRNKVSGDIAVWYMNGPALINGAVIYQAMPLSWEIAAH